jgi:hypothetical protein
MLSLAEDQVTAAVGRQLVSRRRSRVRRSVALTGTSAGRWRRLRRAMGAAQRMPWRPCR